MISALALCLALAIDRWLGEPPPRVHPVVWMGNFLGWSGRWLQRRARPAGVPDVPVLVLGALAWCVGAACCGVLAWGLQDWVRTLHPALAMLLLGLLLKPLLAWAMLKSEVQAVEIALSDSLAAGRERLGWLVSRDVSILSEARVRESAIESLAENLNDSVVAPIFWFALLGLPGAALYRFANTADAMWGYRGIYKGQNWEWAGKWAARADDVLSYLPARLTGLLLALLHRLPLGQLRAQAGLTPSPNSGWPMAAMALALNIRLGKPGVYVLNAGGREPGVGDTRHAIVKSSHVVRLLLLGVGVALGVSALCSP